MRPFVLLSAVVVSLGCLAIWGAASLRRPVDRPGVQLPPPGHEDFGRVPDFNLTDAQGHSVTRKDIQGPWIAGFMFASCSKQCPMLTAKMNALDKKLQGVRLVSFSVDPRDTPESLSRFSNFNRADWSY